MVSVTYLDCNATSPIDPDVLRAMQPFLDKEFGNAGSRTHAYGAQARRAVEEAREQVARAVAADPPDVVFTSGATESNNLALLGLQASAEQLGRTHIVTSTIEHKAILEPIELLRQRGFQVSLVDPGPGGRVNAQAVLDVVQDNTMVVSIMHANNETGVLQPINEIARGLENHSAYFHTDAAQGFGKDFETLANPRIDLMSISGHKIYGPKGIGALIIRRREQARPKLTPLMYGGGQERGLRPGTMPVHLAAGFGAAAESAMKHHENRQNYCEFFKAEMLAALKPLSPEIHGGPENVQPHVVNLSFGNIDSEALMLTLKDEVAISNGSACTSSSYEPSHVLRAMGLSEAKTETATRWSWCHMTPKPNWNRIVTLIKRLY